LDYAREQKAKEVFLEVREDRPNPQSLYKSLGFLTIDRRENYYQPDGVAAIVMRLELGSEK
jgi:ribosomal protein S18 acetylase RimI-like enzyme